MRPLTLTELAKMLDVPLSSCLHIMRTLERRGYVYSLGPRQGYYPSTRMFRNSETIAKHDPLLRILAPKLAALRERTKETIVLSQRVEHELVILDVYDSPQSIRYSADRGDTRPLYSTALGKALLGGMRPADRAKLLDRIKLTAITGTTIIDRGELETHLDASTERGWYRSDSENVAELFAIAINFRFGSDVFSIGIAGPYRRMVDAEPAHAATLLEFKQELGDLGSAHVEDEE